MAQFSTILSLQGFAECPNSPLVPGKLSGLCHLRVRSHQEGLTRRGGSPGLRMRRPELSVNRPCPVPGLWAKPLVRRPPWGPQYRSSICQWQKVGRKRNNKSLACTLFLILSVPCFQFLEYPLIKLNCMSHVTFEYNLNPGSPSDFYAVLTSLWWLYPLLARIYNLWGVLCGMTNCPEDWGGGRDVRC